MRTRYEISLYQTKLKSELDTAEKKLKNLTNALIGELIDEEEFKISKKQIKFDINMYRQKLEKLTTEKDFSIEETIKVFDFIVGARSKFNHGTIQEKKEIFRSLGLNWTLKDGQLHGVAFPWFIPIQDFIKDNKQEITPFERIKNSTDKRNIGTKKHIFNKWSGERGLNSYTQGLKP